MRAGFSSVRFRGASALTIAALALAILSGHNAPLLVYNASASAPIGLYRVLKATQLQLGDLVLVRTPDTVRDLAAIRRYIPANIPLVKRIAARSGLEVCAMGGDINIDGHRVAEQLPADGEGRKLPAWTGCHRLARDELFLLMQDVPNSFDSRYFGPVHVSDVIGRLVPLWQR